MKATLKGRGRYFPGVLYGLITETLIGYITWAVHSFFGIKLFPESTGAGIAFMIALILVTIASLKIGVLIFRLTQTAIGRMSGTDEEKAHKTAVTLEVVMFFVTIFLGTFISTRL